MIERLFTLKCQSDDGLEAKHYYYRVYGRTATEVLQLEAHLAAFVAELTTPDALGIFELENVSGEMIDPANSECTPKSVQREWAIVFERFKAGEVVSCVQVTD